MFRLLEGNWMWGKRLHLFVEQKKKFIAKDSFDFKIKWWKIFDFKNWLHCKVTVLIGKCVTFSSVV